MRDSWPERFERAGLLERVGLVGGGAVRLLANAIDKGLDRAASVAVEAKQAFERELDPNMSDARVLDESDEPFDQPDR
ncbi:hypothetical protein B1759_02070 [Rubrivirga sp. SAORIC476]|uniref:hypothetical protein n=1 Tax=Rubrivirga sp. SAORIC476 TaxID=1961794 RepID=UPI000BA93703|nr:hypothetical protein [Rubrivirga sp. SAORIC476]MAQ92108.1 hypothetical protein [Rhodothermaceae bacterium]MBC13502.1 hypothetical protein [Rhodothermaceae bacterium]PAP80207.1 hypothetical protein B1759_02070 [Rubrivirga sp. SAORIC476]